MIAAMKRLTAHRMVMPLTARVICARLVRERARFLAGEILHPPGVRVYRLRESGLRVALRHRGSDSATLAEVFYHRWYDLPAEVARAIGEPSSIVDLGANIGMFGALAVTRWPAARIVGYEPDPANAAVHERTIAANGLSGRWSLVLAAAGARAREVRFAAGLNASSHVLGRGGDDEGETITVSCLDVLEQVCGADLVKIDIEGGEWEIICDPRFASDPPRVLVLEYHASGCPGSDPRAQAEGALEAAGLRVSPIWHGDGVGMVWGWRAAG